MYFVDREQIEQTLSYMEACIVLFEQQKSWEQPIEKLALERIAHTLIEAIIDVGNSMIDGFIMRDPGSYEDIVDILVDENVIAKKDGEGIKNLVFSRKMLVQSYRAINHEEVLAVITNNLTFLKNFPINIRSYVEKELGPVSAFLPTEKKD